MEDDEGDPCEDCGEVHMDLNDIYLSNPMDPSNIKKVDIKLSDIYKRLKIDGYDAKKHPMISVLRIGRFVEKMLDEAFGSRISGKHDAVRSYRKMIRYLKAWMKDIGCLAVYDLARAMHMSNRELFLEFEAAMAKEELTKGLDSDESIYKLLS
jgi:hypothetical protein